MPFILAHQRIQSRMRKLLSPPPPPMIFFYSKGNYIPHHLEGLSRFHHEAPCILAWKKGLLLDWIIKPTNAFGQWKGIIRVCLGRGMVPIEPEWTWLQRQRSPWSVTINCHPCNLEGLKGMKVKDSFLEILENKWISPICSISVPVLKMAWQWIHFSSQRPTSIQ